MRQFIQSHLCKALVLSVTLVIFGAGVLSMAVMAHPGGVDCADAMDHSVPGAMETHAAPSQLPAQSDSCLNFHWNLLQKFSMNLMNYSGFVLLFIVLVVELSLFVAGKLLAALLFTFNIRKVRLRQLLADTATVFLDTLGRWLLTLEKRDPSDAAGAYSGLSFCAC